jgi:DNA-directed RNA polymerase
MKHLLIKSLTSRCQAELAPQSPLRYLKNLDVDDYIDNAIAVIYLYTRAKRGANKNTIYLTEVISAIGHNLRNKFKLKRDSSLAAKTGAFILYTFEELGMVQVTLGKSSNGHGAYIIQVTNDDAICKLWAKINTDKIEKLPSETPYADWTTARHITGTPIIKTGNKDVIESVNLTSHPMLFSCLNKAQHVGWQINSLLYDIQLWALRNKTDAFAEIWENQNSEARATKLREAHAISDIAGRFKGKTFYHLYYYDFRGRKYCASAYLHEQGSDLAKGLLLRNDKKRIGSAGFFWLTISIASNWAGDAGREDNAKTDKIPLLDRHEWVLDNEEIFISYAESPKVNQGWMKADKPWQFLAACLELRKFRNWQQMMRLFKPEENPEYDEYGFESHLEVYIDGSTNGSQHLTALTRDEITAPYVNLVPLDLPGDLYKYVADHVWDYLSEVASAYTKKEIQDCEAVIDNLIEFKKDINESEPRSDTRKALVEEIRKFKQAHEDLMVKAAPLFWLRITDAKYRRKIVKRNVMTISYGSTAYGMGEQQILDAKKHGVDQLSFMEHRWGAYLGREVYNVCKRSLKRPMQLLAVFEEAGRQAEMAGEFLSWTVPITNFPVVQNYVQGKTKKIWTQYGPPAGPRLSTGYYTNTLQLFVCFIEDVVPSKRKQAQGASPNVIHSLDAAHLTITVDKADYAITTVHDSFGCLLADMPDLFKLIRETFVELYEADPLTSIMKDIKGDISEITIGTLDLSLILESEFCFV